MDWVFLSPHLDDAVYSCGGLIWELIRSGQRVEICSVCAGDPPDGPLTPFAGTLHARWQTGREAAARRRAEDQSACDLLGAFTRHLPIPDCIYRRLPDGEPVIRTNADLFRPPLEGETALVVQLKTLLAEQVPPGARLVCPLGLGSHIDHLLVRAAALALSRALWFYADMPYAILQRPPLDQWLPAGCQPLVLPVSRPGLSAWQAAAAAYRSQTSTFWRDDSDLRAQIETYWQTALGAHALWQVDFLAKL